MSVLVDHLLSVVRAMDRKVEALAAKPSLRAIRDGLLGVVPCLILSATLLVLAVCLEMLGVSAERVAVLNQLYDRITAITPYLVTASIAYMVAIQAHLPRLPVMFLNLTYLACVSQLMEHYNGAARIVFLLSAILIPIWATRALAVLHAKPWCHLARIEGTCGTVRETMNFIIPGILVAALVLLTMTALILVLPAPDWINYYLFMDYANEPYQVGVTYSLLNSILWFFGVHGYHALLPMLEGLEQALQLNYATVMAGGSGLAYSMNSAFLGAFVFIGGSGATLSLALAILCSTRVPNLVLLAMASLPLALMNVNELLLFGLPVIFNPRLLLPFVLVPVLNVLVGQTAIELGWVQGPYINVPFNSPVLLNAYLATGGDPGAVVLQLVNLTLGILLYRPFVSGLETRFVEGQAVIARSIETLFARHVEEAEHGARDTVTDGLRERKSKLQLRQKLDELGDYEFLLEYQPQVNPHTGVMTGVEALVRAENSAGQLLLPSRFMPQLEQGGMMRAMDIWVVREACRQANEWARAGYRFKVSINLSAEGLCDARVVDDVIELLSTCQGQVALEITEQALTAEPAIVKHHIDRIRGIGVQVYIDDFGTGYSSLGYLSQFSVDAIKIDRSFVLALDSDKGGKVFSGILGFAEALELDVIIEGVETREQLAHVMVANRASVQGWLFSRSLRSEQIPAFADHAARMAEESRCQA